MKTEPEIQKELADTLLTDAGSEFQNGWSIGFIRALEWVLGAEANHSIVFRLAAEAHEKAKLASKESHPIEEAKP